MYKVEVGNFDPGFDRNVGFAFALYNLYLLGLEGLRLRDTRGMGSDICGYGGFRVQGLGLEDFNWCSFWDGLNV